MYIVNQSVGCQQIFQDDIIVVMFMFFYLVGVIFEIVYWVLFYKTFELRQYLHLSTPIITLVLVHSKN